jgi:hypothetical protein
VWAFSGHSQQVTGINVFLYFGATIFKNMSASTGVDAGLLQQIVINGACVLFTVVAIATVDKWGRKPLMFLGRPGMGQPVAMGAWPRASPTRLRQRLDAAVHHHLRGLLRAARRPGHLGDSFRDLSHRHCLRALGLATFFLWMADYAVTQTFPMMDAKDSWFVQRFNHAFPFYVYAVFCLALILVLWRLVPETKGRTLEQIQQMWRRKQ